MLKNLLLITMCLVFLISCGRKNDPKFEAFLNDSTMFLKDTNKVFKMLKKNEIYQ
jgi:hypothetical protein